MFVHDMREGGMYATETYTTVSTEALADNRLEISSCYVVYADRDKPSHSVRIFLMLSSQPQTNIVRN